MVTTQMAEILDTSFREWRTGSGCRSRRGSRRRIFLFFRRGGGGGIVVVFLFSGICAYGRRAVATCRRHFSGDI